MIKIFFILTTIANHKKYEFHFPTKYMYGKYYHRELKREALGYMQFTNGSIYDETNYRFDAND